MVSLQTILLACLLGTSSAFQVATHPAGGRTTTVVLYGEGTGGWGLGNSREMVPEEFSKGGDRRAFEGYELTDRGQFMRNVKKDAESMRSNELNELLGVAKIAGLKVKDPSERLNKFEADLLDDEEDLDLSV